jgi:hypothetical protein
VLPEELVPEGVGPAAQVAEGGKAHPPPRVPTCTAGHLFLTLPSKAYFKHKHPII